LRKSSIPGRAITLNDAQISRLKQRFLENVLSTGSPEMSGKVHDDLVEELQLNKKDYNFRRRLGNERRTWMRAAAVLRRKGVDEDNANIPHLAWLEEVGRL
jgi:hypothetical protein